MASGLPPINQGNPGLLQALMDGSLSDHDLMVLEHLAAGPPPPQQEAAPQAPQQGTGANIVGGFAGLQDQPQPVPQSFGMGLLSGFGRGLGSAGSRVQAQQAKLEADAAQREQVRQAQNQAATLAYQNRSANARGSILGDLIKAQTEKGNKTPVLVAGPDGKPVYSEPSAAIGKPAYEKPEKPEKPGAPVAVIDPKTGKAKYVTPQQAIGMAPAKEASAAAQFDPHDYADPDKADTSTLGYKYVNLGAIPDKKQQAAVADLARKQGTVVISAKEKSALDLVDKARDHYAALAAAVGMPLPEGQWHVPPLKNYGGPLAQSQLDPGRILKPFEQSTGIGGQADQLKNLKTFNDVAITTIQALGGLGTGVRINLPQIEQTLRNNLPKASDTAEQVRNKINTTIELMNETERALLHARNPQAAKVQQAGNAGARVANTPVPGGFFDRLMKGGL